MAKSSNADMSETENLFSMFYSVSSIYLKFGVFSNKKDQSHSLSIKEVINGERGNYLNVQKGIFHATHRKTTC